MKTILFAFLLLGLGLGIRVGAQPAWQVDPHAFEHSMVITGTVSVEGVPATDAGDLVAAFSGGVCRGKSNLTFDPALNGWFVYLMVYSNASGEPLTFYYYDASAGEIVRLSNQVTFGVNQIVGSPDEPYQFKAVTTGITSGIPNGYPPVALSGSTGINHWESSQADPANGTAGFVIWPNPCRDRLTVRLSSSLSSRLSGSQTSSLPSGLSASQSGSINYYLMTIDGKIVRSGESRHGGTTMIDTGDLRSGTYVLTLQNGSRLYSRCILKE